MENKNLEEFITNYPDWYEEDDELVAGFEFKDFTATRALVEKIMKLADKLDHHPTVTFGYDTLEIRTTTHDKGSKITEKDLVLAESISKLVS